MNKSAHGFTLIELLIAIAILGIIAAALIPNLMGARDAAVNRGANAYARNILGAASAYIAEDPGHTTADFETADCTAGFSDVVGYELQNPGSVITACSVTAVNNTQFTVSVTSRTGVTFNLP